MSETGSSCTKCKLIFLNTYGRIIYPLFPSTGNVSRSLGYPSDFERDNIYDSPLFTCIIFSMYMERKWSNITQPKRQVGSIDCDDVSIVSLLPTHTHTKWATLFSPVVIVFWKSVGKASNAIVITNSRATIFDTRNNIKEYYHHTTVWVDVGKCCQEEIALAAVKTTRWQVSSVSLFSYNSHFWTGQGKYERKFFFHLLRI